MDVEKPNLSWFCYPPIQVVITLATKQTKAHWKSITHDRATRTALNQPWKASPPGWIKINTDASFANGVSYGGITLRCNCGSFLKACTSFHNCVDAISAESLALLHACHLVASLKIKNAIFETDCLNDVTGINGAYLNSS
ncbi:hypothetical protein CASFOL_037556 [Castilleja foliolosa]|uniref:RNase H type-1 domain-containing protein n=1 Tax=Castilleja foliolosa TaxID=1961234 RepID=A0ABD3BMW6_9LAMI